ncbi:hypothetical protein FPZ54_18070 [Sphingomonas suaedae]|uniref:Uncharacterized protein n=1 Tax=Sphingomonas suaedae TaxID=2599297 RepID=A0A518RJU6_9SPHN|nr:hypothetical protein [Sphingomonas suaedae]QDX27725.1 hypothetical protein FPZ54_18070 [Sphingomonas suaedae]
MATGRNWVLASDLNQRIDSIGARAARAATAELAADLDAIRVIAAANGITPALPIVHALESALAAGQRGPMIADGLSLLRDAVACGRSDPRTGAAFAAACAIRLAS